MNNTAAARYTRQDGKVSVIGRWHHRGGCLWLGEVSVVTSAGVMRFSSVSPMDAQGLSGYASDAYLARHASKFMTRNA